MYPVNLIITNQPCLVVGGGTVAFRKVCSLLDAGAVVTVIAPDLSPKLAELQAAHRICWLQKSYEAGDAAGFFLLICATTDPHINELAAAEGRSGQILVNVVDQPEKCNFTVPSVVHRGDLQFTISTNGKAPALSRWLRLHLEEEFDDSYGQWLDRLAAIRQDVKEALPDIRCRQEFWRTALSDQVMTLVHEGNLKEAEALMRHAISRFRTQS